MPEIMTPTERKNALLERGISLASIARIIGRGQYHVAAVNRGDRRAAAVERAIAAAIGQPVEQVFPPLKRQSAA